MARVKRGIVVKRKHKDLLEQAKGYRGSRSRLIKRAHEAVLHSGEYAFTGRKLRKRDMRALWINRISQACKSLDFSYKDFIYQLKIKKILLNRKILAKLVVEDFDTFKKVVEKTRA